MNFLIILIYNLGGISSYCLFIMIIAYLKESNMGFFNDISHILLNFLNFYGNNFNPEKTGIALGPLGMMGISPFY
jgi:hypothetical protein